MNNISSSALIKENVTIGTDACIEEFSIIGKETSLSKLQETNIGDNCLIRAGTYIYAGNKIGDNFSTGNKANIREDNIIGNNVSIGTLTNLEHNIIIGNNVRVHSQSFIPEFTYLEDNVWIGPNVTMTNAKYPNNKNTKDNLKGPRLCTNAKIGANVTIMPGITIGQNSLVGAGCIVLKDVPDNVVVVGNNGDILKNIRDLYD